MRAIAFVLAVLAAPLLPVRAQSPEAYKVELTMRDATDASAKAGRRYVIVMDTHGTGTFKVGSRDPVATGSFQPGAGGTGINPLVNTQYSYVDTGVNIECRLEQVEGKLQLRADLDISSTTPPKTPIPNPSIGQLKISLTAMLTAGKRTVVASIDDPVTNRKFDVEALITKVE
jgi:hypothetical protein